MPPKPNRSEAKIAATQLKLQEVKTKLEISKVRTKFATSVLINLIRWGGMCYIAFCIADAIDALSGKTTSADIAANIGVKMLANEHAGKIVFALIGSGGVAYGLRQKSLYKKASKKLQRMDKLERRIDPNRSGSGLDDGSETNPEDVV